MVRWISVWCPGRGPECGVRSRVRCMYINGCGGVERGVNIICSALCGDLYGGPRECYWQKTDQQNADLRPIDNDSLDCLFFSFGSGPRVPSLLLIIAIRVTRQDKQES